MKGFDHIYVNFFASEEVSEWLEVNIDISFNLLPEFVFSLIRVR